MSDTQSCFAPVAARTGTPVRLAMQRLWLTGRIMAAGARLVVQHVFQSDEEAPLEVIYAFPLPRDAALRGFRIVGDDFEAHSELKETEAAVKAYEQGIADGSLAALARQYDDGIVNLTVGNIRPKETVTVYLELLAGVELRDDGFRFRFPFTLAPGYHSRMRTAVTDGEGELELPADQFGDVILPRFRKDASSLHAVGFELSVLHPLPLGEIGSPSHPIKLNPNSACSTRIALAPERDLPNRDLVLDVRVQSNQTQVLAGPDGDGKRFFAAVLPSTLFGERIAGPRRTAILLDRSGSMQGEPIAQARKAIAACLAAMTEEDSFGLIAFDDRVETMDPAVVPATRKHRESAAAFLKDADARGGTELAAGVQAAARMLGGQGDIVIITDGQVFGTENILEKVRGSGVRLFCLGIGSASQDRFLSLLARETGGISRFVTARERVDLAALDLFASIGRPVASGLKVPGVQPEAPSAVFAGTPVLLFGELESGTSSRIDLTWEGGRMSFDVPPGDPETGATVRLLRGSRLITDWESRYPSEEALASIEKRKNSRVSARLLELSKTYGLASREMSLVAVVKRTGDRAGELPETRVVPVGMPGDTSFSAYFTAAPKFARDLAKATFTQLLGGPPAASSMPSFSRSVPPVESAQPKARRTFRLFDFARRPAQDSGTSLMDLAALLEPDGGMPGDNVGVRTGRTIAALFAFVAEGHTVNSGAFRLHVTRLIEFLKSVHDPGDTRARLIQKAIDAAATGSAPPGKWLALAGNAGARWKDIEAAFR